LLSLIAKNFTLIDGHLSCFSCYRTVNLCLLEIWNHYQHSYTWRILLNCYTVLLLGRFLAELTKEVFADLEASKYQVI
jgi:hypothetical protein